MRIVRDTGRPAEPLPGRARTGCVGLSLLMLLAVAAPTRAAEEPSSAPAELGEAPILSIGGLEYRPGRGLQVGDTGLVIGGFTNVKAETTPDAGYEFALDNLNVFLIFDRFTRFRAVAELQLKDIFDASDEAVGTQDFAFDVRRLFGDFTLADTLRVRAGTFLTPVGYWNLILAPPLTWTTEAAADRRGDLLPAHHHRPDALRRHRRRRRAARLLALLAGPAPARGRSRSRPSRLHRRAAPDLRTRPGVDGRAPRFRPPTPTTSGRSWARSICCGSTAAARSSASSTCRAARRCSSTQWGTYVQGVLELYGPLFAVGRYEHFAPPTPDPTLNLFTIGAVLRPLPFMAVKVEYRFVDRSTTIASKASSRPSPPSSEMGTTAYALLSVACLAGCLLGAAAPLQASDIGVKVIVHPTRAATLTKDDVRAIYLKQKRFWSDGRAIIPINLEAGSEARERFSESVFGQGSRRLAAYWNQRYFEEGGFPPATLGSPEAVIRFVAGNENAIGYVAQEDVGDSVAVALVLP